MAMIARILGVSLLTSFLVAVLGVVLIQFALLGSSSASRPSTASSGEYIVLVLFLGSVGGVIGAVAGAAREIVSAQRRKASDWIDTP
jgi:hypothetical protein